jgi:formylglycine-generating enzyme required for sulfatase activity
MDPVKRCPRCDTDLPDGAHFCWNCGLPQEGFVTVGEETADRFAYKGRLPGVRALLYEDAVDILLWRWEEDSSEKGEGPPRLARLLLDADRTDIDLKRTLWWLAFEAHRRQCAGRESTDEDTTADIDRAQLEQALARLHPQGDRDWAQRMIEALERQAGLLVERVRGRYTFPHQTFQEYLAGAYLSTQADFVRRAARLLDETALWREVVLLAARRLVYLIGDVDKPLALVGELCPGASLDNRVAWQKVWLAGDILVEMGLNRVRDTALGRDLAERVRHRLADLLWLGRLRPVERAAAGRSLARLGDPRPGVGLLPSEPGQEKPKIPDLLWCYVPSGPFLTDRVTADDEVERHYDERFVAGFVISGYPITNAQFAAFVEAGGYQERRHWAEAEQASVWSAGSIKDKASTQPRVGPHDYGDPFNLPNHPVVGVTWYEAVAFCRWLTEQLRGGGYRFQVWRDGQFDVLRAESKGEILSLRPETLVVQLPSEAEWEKAARGTDGRIYPWGDDLDPEQANYVDTGIGTTNTVGCFPDGASPYQVEDLCGNVQEWTRSLWREQTGDQAMRVLCGAAFDAHAEQVRCTYRGKEHPGFHGRHCGFRVVASPVHIDQDTTAD